MTLRPAFVKSGIGILLLAAIGLGLSACGRPASRMAQCYQVPAEASGVPSLRAAMSPSFPASPAVPAGRSLVTGISPEDEIWVIARTPETVPPADDDGTPGCGTLMCRLPDAPPEQDVPLPLEHTDVDATISGYIASVTVRQQFHNPYDAKIEAVYVFPLPQNAAVNEFVMTIGDRRIRGIIREREEAEEIYYEARRQGYTASLLTQERPNIFTQRVANIEPGKRIDVELAYFSTLSYSDGWYQFVFPMVVGPRFNPPGTTDGVAVVPRGRGGGSGQGTEVHYLPPHERSGHDIALSLDIDAGVPIEEITCASHVIETARENSSRTHVRLSPRDGLPNKDFVLHYRVAGATPRASLLTHRDDRGGWFTLMLYPPRELSHERRSPIEMVFVVDCSGSMRGEPIAKAKRAVERALRQLESDDTFQVVRFSDQASALGRNPLPATRSNVEKGLRFVRSLEANGGTMMIGGIRAALDFPADPGRVRFVTFLTDGFIGNEAEILGEVHERLGASRIFSLGIGSSPNRYLMNRLAKLGRGAAAYVGLNDDPTKVMDLFIERVRHPALTDLSVDFGALAVDGLYPERLPDLLVGRPVILTGRFEGSDEATVRIEGRVGQERVEIPIIMHVDDASTSHDALPSVWARMRIADLSDRATYDPDLELHDEIRGLALEYGLMSAYTAFVAVDSSRRTEGDSGTTVPVAVPVPEGVPYHTTVSQ